MKTPSTLLLCSLPAYTGRKSLAASVEEGTDVAQKRVRVFTSPTCHWCRVAKAYLTDSGIEFTECDIVADIQARREMVLMTGQYGVPVVQVGDKAIVGWNEEEFRRLLALKPKR